MDDGTSRSASPAPSWRQLEGRVASEWLRYCRRRWMVRGDGGARLNVDRREYDRLKAVLTNSVRYGPDSQNREGRPEFRAHLSGRVAWVEHVNPRRGARLRLLAERIDWGPGARGERTPLDR